jgi:signal transduction histidine kinase
MDAWPYHSTPAEEDFLPGRVVVVEDDPLQAKLLVRAIEELGEGWSAVAVPDAEQCMTLLQTTTFSLALIDLVLPDRNGLELIQAIRTRGHVLAMVLVTAHGSEDVAARALRLGVSDYIQKREGYIREVPFVVSRIVAQHRRNLRKLSEHSRLRMELAQQTHKGLIDSFAAPIVHDIKNPLSVIRTAAEMLLGKPAASARELVPMICRCVGRIQELLDQLLRFARQEHEERVSMDLNALLLEISFAEGEALRLHNILLVRALPTEPVRVRGARRGLEQVFLNLIANAGEALAKNHGGGIIHLEVRQEGETAVVAISDNGPGIPVEMFPRLFTPYSTHGKVRGTGLGLSISAGVVREHGGDIQAENLPGSGARFNVRLPLERHGPTALVLEDEEHMQELITAQLSQLGIRAETVGDGEELIRRLPGGRWDVVILDIRTPKVSGVEGLREIAAKRPDLVPRTMLLSGSIADRDVQEVLTELGVPCLPKPYGMEELSDMVRLLMRGRQPTAPKA